MELRDVVLFLIEARPGRSTSELTQAVFADAAREEAVDAICKSLVESGLIVEEQGNDDQPSRYYPLAL